MSSFLSYYIIFVQVFDLRLWIHSPIRIRLLTRHACDARHGRLSVLAWSVARPLTIYLYFHSMSNRLLFFFWISWMLRIRKSQIRRQTL